MTFDKSGLSSYKKHNHNWCKKYPRDNFIIGYSNDFVIHLLCIKHHHHKTVIIIVIMKRLWTLKNPSFEISVNKNKVCKCMYICRDGRKRGLYVLQVLYSKIMLYKHPLFVLYIGMNKIKAKRCHQTVESLSL